MIEYSLKILNDLSSIHLIMHRCASSFFNQSLNAESILQCLSEKFYKNAQVVQICNDNKLVGFAAYYCNDFENKNAFLSMIVILKEYQSMGAGGVLLKYIIEDCKRVGMDNLLLEVDKKNEFAINFYLKKGFVFLSKETKDGRFMSLSIK